MSALEEIIGNKIFTVVCSSCRQNRKCGCGKTAELLGGWALSILSHFSRNFRFQVRWYSQFQSVSHEICRTMSVSSHSNHYRESPRLDFCNRKHCYTGHFSFRDRKFRCMEITAFSSPEPTFLLVTWSEKRNDILSLRMSGSGDENEITPSHWSMNSL